MKPVLEHVVRESARFSPRAHRATLHVRAGNASVRDSPGVTALRLFLRMRERAREPVMTESFRARKDLQAKHPEAIGCVERVVFDLWVGGERLVDLRFWSDTNHQNIALFLSQSQVVKTST